MQPCSFIVLTGSAHHAPDGPQKTGQQTRAELVHLDRLIAAAGPLTDQVIIVAEKPAAYVTWDALIVKPHFDQPGQLNRIHAGLFACRHPYALVATCDRPFLQTGLARALISELGPKWDAVLPRSAAGPQPLPGVYAKSCLARLGRVLEKNTESLAVFIDRIRVKVIEEATLRVHDPELISLLDVNHPETPAKAQDSLPRRAADHT